MKGTPEQRFWAKVDKNGPIPEYAPHLGPCWVWLAGLAGHGYGRFFVRPQLVIQAHRFAYELLVGPIPEGLQIDHLCRVRRCVNPAHLEPVTNRENGLRGLGLSAQKAAQTHCVNGHEFNEENTYRAPRGTRACRRCRADTEARRRQRLSEDANRPIVPCSIDGCIRPKWARDRCNPHYQQWRRRNSVSA